MVSRTAPPALASISVCVLVRTVGDGGAESKTLAICEALQSQGMRVHVVATYCQSSDGLSSRLPLKVLRARSSLLAALRFALFARAQRPSVVLTTGMTCNLIGMVLKRLGILSVPLIVREQSPFAVEISNFPFASIVRDLSPALFARVDRVVCLTEAAGRELATITRMDRGRIKVIYNPVRIGSPPPDSQPRARPVGRNTKVLAVGRLSSQKAFDNLIRAFDSVRSHCRAELTILGEGEQRGYLEGLVRELGLEDDVALPGFVDDVRPYLRNCDVFVSSSRYEGMQNALLEALAEGCQIVATDCKFGAREILGEGRFGQLVPPDDIDRLAEAIAAAIYGKTYARVDESHLAKFRWDHAVGLYREVLLEVAD